MNLGNINNGEKLPSFAPSVNEGRAREQTNLRRILDHMIIGNQMTIARDEKARAAGGII
jgi:hypothetical protein